MKKYQSNHIAEKLGIRHDYFRDSILNAIATGIFPETLVNTTESQAAGRPHKILLLEQKHLFRLPQIFSKNEIALDLFDRLMNEIFHEPKQEFLTLDLRQSLELNLKLLNEKEAAETALAIASPKAELHDIFLQGHGSVDINEVAKSIKWGRNKLFEQMRNDKILMKNNLPFQEYMDRGYFEVIQVPKEHGKEVVNHHQTRVFPKGVTFLVRKYGKGN